MSGPVALHFPMRGFERDFLDFLSVHRESFQECTTIGCTATEIKKQSSEYHLQSCASASAVVLPLAGQPVPSTRALDRLRQFAVQLLLSLVSSKSLELTPNAAAKSISMV